MMTRRINIRIGGKMTSETFEGIVRSLAGLDTKEIVPRTFEIDLGGRPFEVRSVGHPPFLSLLAEEMLEWAVDSECGVPGILEFEMETDAKSGFEVVENYCVAHSIAFETIDHTNRKIRLYRPQGPRQILEAYIVDDVILCPALPLHKHEDEAVTYSARKVASLRDTYELTSIEIVEG